ncbi:HD domain-containing phosphohydrolase [Treponema zioleckii]|uniref:HD domain-containing phosphohydrolase n=1 Tax=Treponema zioleckii TaxID=331680 RepID=UPI00168C00CF|nr:HD domain-containing phosphohydrolase [Treponema zioleckii]
MKNPEIYKPYQIVGLVFLSMGLNVGGRVFADSFNLPLWLDSFGTFLTAYCLGPVCGAIVGVSGNILHGLINPISFIYSITSIFIAVIVGILARRGWFETLLKTMSLSVLVTLVCVAISVTLNVAFYGGDVGNPWGNGIVEEFSFWGLPRPFCIVLGQFYMDFLDKVITLVLLFVALRVYRVLKPFLPRFLKIAPVFLIALLPFFSAHKTYAEARNYNSYAHTVYNKENGVQGGKANDIASTNDGILWIGTYEGLYRHNGHEFRLMNEFESIKAVRSLYVDDEGRLFVGTNDNGLSIIINETVMNVLEEKDGLPSDTVRSIIRGSDGLYYVGTIEDLAVLSLADGLGVLKIVPQIQSAIVLTSDEHEHIAAVTAKGGLFLLENGAEIIWSSKDINERFTSAFFLPDGTLCASTENSKLLRFSINGNEVSEVDEIACKPLKHINSLDYYDDTLFLCADNGVGCICNGKFSLIETGGFNNSIDNMTQDYQGNLWFASSRLGVLKMSQTSFTELYSSSNLPVSVVNSTVRFLGDIYFATDDGLMALSGKTGHALKNELTEALSGTRVRCLTLSKDGSLWISTKSRGIIHALPDGTMTNVGRGHEFRLAIELSDGTIVAGANDGIGFITNDEIFQWLGEKDGLETSVILTLSENRDGRILAGTDGGGLALIKKNVVPIKNDDEGDLLSVKYSISRLIKRSDGLSSNVILRTVNDFDGVLPTNGVFVVTSNSLCYVNFSNNKVSCKLLSNFPFSNNYDLVVRENKNIFVLSGAGIFVVNRDELLSGEKLDFELLDLKKGLRGSLTANSWNYLDENGDLYLSCDNGANRINLNTYDKAEHSYRMQLKSVLIDGKRHIVQKDIPFVISAESTTLEIVPEIINYSLNTPYISLYFEGGDEKPAVMLQSELSSIVYTNLRAGEYKFHLGVLDSKGRETVEEATYILSKTYRIYDNWYFMLYTVGVATLAIAWLTSYVMASYGRKAKEKQKEEMEAIKRQVRMGNETIFSIANAVEARDKSTGRHSFRVAEYAVLIARELDFSEEELEQIKNTGLLHDIGKIGVPDSVLNKPAPLANDEYEVMKTHTIIGGEILKDFTLIPHVDEGARFHHEHYDGSGYPNGLKGEEIPLNARIIGIADAFDAMTATRVYRKALDMNFVVSELKRCSGTQFDPGLVEIMLELIRTGKLNVERTVEESVP